MKRIISALLVLLWFVSPALCTFVQKAPDIDSSGTNSYTTTYSTANLTSGSLLFAMFRIGATLAAAGTVTCSDGTNGAWTLSVTIDSTGDGDSQYSCFKVNNASVGKPTVTIAFTGAAASVRAYVAEYSTSVTTSILDTSGSSLMNFASTPGLGTTPAITTATANTTLIAGFQVGGAGETATDNGTGAAPSTGWTNRAAVGTPLKLFVSDVDVSSTGTYKAAWTITGTGSASDTGSNIILAFKTSGGGGGGGSTSGLSLLHVGN